MARALNQKKKKPSVPCCLVFTPITTVRRRRSSANSFGSPKESVSLHYMRMASPGREQAVGIEFSSGLLWRRGGQERELAKCVEKVPVEVGV